MQKPGSRLKVYDGRCRAERRAVMGTVRYTVLDGEIVSENRNGVIRDYVPDPLGSTVALLDNTQTITDTFSYFPSGTVASRTGTTSTPFQFVGTKGYHADASGKTYVRARVLEPRKSRWLTEDPIGFGGGDWNLYSYARNGPTRLIDTSGRDSGIKWPCVKYCLDDALGGFLIGCATGLTTASPPCLTCIGAILTGCAIQPWICGALYVCQAPCGKAIIACIVRGVIGAVGGFALCYHHCASPAPKLIATSGGPGRTCPSLG